MKMAGFLNFQIGERNKPLNYNQDCPAVEGAKELPSRDDNNVCVLFVYICIYIT